jgi:putative glutamine amidotransferase
MESVWEGESRMKIGIPTSISKTQYFLNQAYVDYVIGAGHTPVAIYPGTNLAICTEMIDALIMPGGIDVDPIHYGYDNFTSYSTDVLKDTFERILFHIVREQNKPIFGICRGFQLIILEYMAVDTAVNRHMYFSQHVDSHSQATSQQLDRTQCVHFIEYFPATLYGDTQSQPEDIVVKPVNSMHHQALIVDVPGDGETLNVHGFRLGAYTNRGVKTTKGRQKAVCEAYRIVNWGGPILAVQWHPEELRDYELLNNFLHNQFGDQQVEADAT